MEVSDGPLNPRSKVVMNWFDQLETVLKKEAALAGLLRHGTSIGNGREFFVRRVLRSFLPAMVHIGSGIVIGNHGERSKQIDIVVYDPRAPMMEITPGAGIYFVEGVIAAIEVKSRLTTKKLREALDNCYSVMKLDWHYESNDDLDRLARRFLSQKLSVTDAREAVSAKIQAPTYIFAFSSNLSSKRIGRTVTDWYNERGESLSPCNPLLPKIVAAEGTIGLQRDHWLTIDAGDAGETMRQRDDTAQVVMGFWPSKRQFGWMALRLMHDTRDRIGLYHFGAQTSLTTDAYIPAEDYFRQDLKESMGNFLFWTGKSTLRKDAAPLDGNETRTQEPTPPEPPPCTTLAD